MNNRAVVALFCAALAGSSFNSARADFTYTETTQVTGGSLISMMKTVGMFSKSARQFGQPVESTVIVKGNRMTHISADRTEIIDLDKGTITQIDNIKHQYMVMTFEQLKQQMDEAVARAKAQQAKQSGSQQPQTPPDAQLKFSVKVRNTGATKDISGLSTKESIMTMALDATSTQQPNQTATMGMTSDLWLAPEIPGYKEVRDFYARMAEKMGSTFGAGRGDMTAALAAQLPPGSMQGMADMAKEMEKLKGTPVQTIVRIGTTANGVPLPAASEAPLPQGPPPPTAGDVAKSAIASSLPFHGFGMGKKKQADQPPATADNNQSASAAVLMETTTQLSSFSSAPVDPAKFMVPAGYKQVEVKDLH